MAAINLHNAEFIRSAATEADLLRDGRPSIVFAGRSNAGKSSVINRILNRNKLAFVSKNPGKTVHVNYFLIDGSLYLADLPGYGFARVSDAEKRRWAKLIDAFLGATESIRCAALIVDVRRAPTEDDLLMADYFFRSGVRYALVANKCDKQKPKENEASLARLREAFAPCSPDEIIAFSALNGEGRDELIAYLFSDRK